jgi:hypothetical protein
MSLFVVQHKHPAERCPAGHPEMGPMLLTHLAPPNAANFGVSVHSEAVIDGEHTFYLILEAENDDKIREFMAPFSQMGTVDVWPASTCEQVVDRGEC